MTSTIEDGEERPEASPRRRFRLRDMYIERRDGPVTMAERRRAALSNLLAVALFAAVVVGIQVVVRDRQVPGTWLAGVGVVTVLFTVLGFAFPRFSPGGNAHLGSIDWSKESTGSKVVAVVALLFVVALVVARAIWRLDK